MLYNGIADEMIGAAASIQFLDKRGNPDNGDLQR